MKRADVLDVKSAGFFEKCLDKRSVFTYDICVISSGIVKPVAVKVHLIGKESAVKSSEGTESICRKENSVCGVEGHHGFRPVHHRSFHKSYCVLAEGEGVSFFNLNFIFINNESELSHKKESFLCADNLDIRIPEKNFFN